MSFAIISQTFMIKFLSVLLFIFSEILLFIFIDTEKMYLVSESCLSKLRRRCPQCGGDVIGQKQLKLGSMLTVALTCCNGHEREWNSQPMIRRKLVGKLLLAASILFTGNS